MTNEIAEHAISLFFKVTMNKSEAILIANESLRANILNEMNTQFSNVVRYAGDEGWWLNIPLTHFRKEIHFLICSDKARIIRHLTIKANNILSPATKFRIKDGVADIFISAANPKRLVDALQGGTKYSFNKHLVDEYRY
jgi:hypothetical protein